MLVNRLVYNGYVKAIDMGMGDSRGERYQGTSTYARGPIIFIPSNVKLTS